MPAKIIRPADRALEPNAESANLPDGRTIGLQVVSDDEPYVHITEIPPNYVIPLHAHSEPEVTVILSGTATVGDTVCEPGTVLLIPAHEEYSIAVGDEPLVFTVMRPRRAAYTRSQ